MMSNTYALYDKCDHLVFSGSSRETAAFLGMNMNTFYSTVSRQKTVSEKRTKRGYKIIDVGGDE